MNKEILNIVNRVLSEEMAGRNNRNKRRIFESDKMCSECGSDSMSENECMECGYMEETELEEKLYGKQHKLDKNKNGRIDRKDFKLLRKESVYSIEIDGQRMVFNENEVIDIIENIILEEKKKDKKTTKLPNVTKDSLAKSKKENDDYVSDVVKKMKDYLKDASKGEYEMEPKHFPKGNGELGDMTKKAYIPSNAVEEYIENFTAAALENIEYDDIKPNENWVEDNLVGSSRTGNNPKWANAVETEVGERRNKIRKDNLLGQIKKKAYNKAPQPVTDEAGENSDKASKLLMKLESTQNNKKSTNESVGQQKVITDIDSIKKLMGYNTKTQ
jgi:hypothetical protein